MNDNHSTNEREVSGGRTEYRVYEFSGQSHILRADSFETREGARAWAETNLDMTVYNTQEDARSAHRGVFIHKIYHDV